MFVYLHNCIIILCTWYRSRSTGMDPAGYILDDPVWQTLGALKLQMAGALSALSPVDRALVRLIPVRWWHLMGRTFCLAPWPAGAFVGSFRYAKFTPLFVRLAAENETGGIFLTFRIWALIYSLRDYSRQPSSGETVSQKFNGFHNSQI